MQVKIIKINTFEEEKGKERDKVITKVHIYCKK